MLALFSKVFNVCATYLFLKPQQKFCSYLCCLFIRFIEGYRKTLPLPPPLNALTSFCASFTFHMDSVPSSRQVQINGASKVDVSAHQIPFKVRMDMDALLKRNIRVLN